MAAYDFDLYVIGAGSGGVRLARIAAQAGAKVGICEDSRVGGTCVIRGCVPKKLLVYASHFAEDFEDAAGYGWTVAPASFDWAKLIANKDREIDRLNLAYKKLLSDANVTLHETRGRLADAHTVALGDDKLVTAQTIVIATGGRPEKPDLPGIEHAITSNEAFHLPALPARIVVVGGGYIACEFAGIFNGLGSRVTQIIRRELVLRGFDTDVRQMVQREMEKKGVAFRAQTSVSRIDKDGAFYRVVFDKGPPVECDLVMYATGRVPNTSGIGLEKVGVALDKAGAVAVDEWSRTTVPNIYAIGDVTNRINLTPVAIMEGHFLANTLYLGKPMKPDHATVASAVFSQPPVGTVGLSEEEARPIYGALDIYSATFRPMKYTLSGRPQQTLMKLVVDAATDRVLGVHMVGDDAPEIVQSLAVAVKAGLTKRQFDATVAVHPTAAEEFVTMRTKRAAPAKAAE